MQIFITLLCGFVLGWIIREQYAVYKIKKFLKVVDTPSDNRKQLRVNIEKHKGVFYLYAEDDGRFIAQGLSKKDVSDVVIKEHPNTIIIATEDNVKEVDFK